LFDVFAFLIHLFSPLDSSSVKSKTLTARSICSLA
jgi:hypothetical protein